MAARKAIAAAQGLKNDEPTRFELGIYEDSLGGRAPVCDPSQAPDTFTSSQLTADELAKFGKAD